MLSRWIALLPLVVACRDGKPDDTGDSDSASDTDTGDPQPRYQEKIGACDIFDTTPIKDVDDLIAEGKVDLPVLQGLGMGIARPHRPMGHVFAREVVSPEGVEDWTLPDYVVQATGAAGVRLFVTLDNQAVLDTKDGPAMQLYVPPEDEESWTTYVERLVERYDGDGLDDMPGLISPVLAYEVGNEPFCSPEDSECYDYFSELVRFTSEAAHRADPDVTLLVGGARPLFFGGGMDPFTEALYRHFYDEGCGTSCTDGLPFHMLTGEASTPVEDYVLAWRDIAGDTPLWLTEVGVWKTSPDNPMVKDPDAAAAWLVGTVESALAEGVGHVLVCKSRHSFTEPVEVHDALRDFIATLPAE